MINGISSNTKLHPGIKALALILLVQALLTVAASAQEKLIFAIDVIRHGDRTPLDQIPAAPHQWAEGLGQLTAAGMKQECQLGAKARALYVDRYHLLSSNYAAGTLYARSTDLDRTLMSAQLFLLGLYPPGTGPAIPATGQPAVPDGLQPIPVHTVSWNSDDLLVPGYDANAYRDLLVRHVFSTPEWKEKTAQLQPKFARWSEASGIRITDLNQLGALADDMYIYQLYHVPLPAGIADDSRTIIDAGQWAFVQSYKPAEIGRVTGGTLLKKVAGYLRQGSEGTSPLKYVLFSAHDTTLLGELSALGAPLTNAPPYAANLKFTLFKTGQNTFRVEISYNDQPVTIPAFNGSSGSLARFEAFAGSH